MNYRRQFFLGLMLSVIFSSPTRGESSQKISLILGDNIQLSDDCAQVIVDLLYGVIRPDDSGKNPQVCLASLPDLALRFSDDITLPDPLYMVDLLAQNHPDSPHHELDKVVETLKSTAEQDNFFYCVPKNHFRLDAGSNERVKITYMYHDGLEVSWPFAPIERESAGQYLRDGFTRHFQRATHTMILLRQPEWRDDRAAADWYSNFVLGGSYHRTYSEIEDWVLGIRTLVWNHQLPRDPYPGYVRFSHDRYAVDAAFQYFLSQTSAFRLLPGFLDLYSRYFGLKVDVEEDRKYQKGLVQKIEEIRPELITELGLTSSNLYSRATEVLAEMNETTQAAKSIGQKAPNQP
jgi:hypothetical protein